MIDPYIPLTEAKPGLVAPAERTELAPEEEPTTTGTIVIMLLFLMALAALWGIMYLTLLRR